MRRLRKPGWLVLLLVLVAVLLPGSLSCGSSGGSSAETKVTFLQDWEAAKAQAASEGKPIMINFYTDT